MGERIFVTGASGQIGLPLVRELVAQGHTVTGLCRSDAAAQAVEAAGAKALRGGMTDVAVLEEGVKNADVVYHLAGGVRGAGEETADVLNRQGTENLCTAALPYRKQLKALVFASTCAVYGDRNGLWVAEDYAPAPHTKYGESKVAAEAHMLRAAREQGLPVRVARIAAVYGPGLRFMMADRMLAGKAWLPGEGLNLVPIVHIDDCVSALITIAERGQNAQIYHIAGRSTPLLKEFYADVYKALAEKEPKAKALRFWSTWIPSAIQNRIAAINEDLKSKMGRKPRFTLDNLKLYTSGVRLRTERLEKELGFVWKYPDHKDGVKASV